MEIRRAGVDDLESFVDVRIEFITQIRTIREIDAFRNSTLAYLRAHIERDDLVIFLAVDQGRIVSSCMACVYQTAPVPSCLTGKTAKLLNVCTRLEYRRRGLAEQLIRLLLAELRARDVEKVVLDYTEDGLPLYQKLGFTILPCQMQLILPVGDR